MSDMTYSAIKTFLDTYVDTNNNNEISGEDVNDALTYLLQGLAGKLFDSTKPYKLGQAVIYQDVTWGYELWVANKDITAGAWDSGNFNRVSSRIQPWATYTPTLTWSGGTPTTTPTVVARYMIEEDKVTVFLDITGENDSGSTITGLKASLPETPEKLDCYWPVEVQYNDDYNPTEYASKQLASVIDAASETAGNRALYLSGTLSIANGNDFRMVMTAIYEIE